MSEEHPARGRGWAWLGLLAVLGVHVALVAYYFGDMLPLPEQPFSRGDFATHAAQVKQVLLGLERAGEPWVYDVQLLAGAPNGVFFDADVKGWELWTWALVELGAGRGFAFNAYVLAIHLALPLVIWASARLFGLERGAANIAAGLAVLMWSFDSFTHWMWFIGTVTYVFVAYFAVLPLALFHRWLEDRRPLHAIACALALAFGHLQHPYSFFILVAPMLALYLRAAVVERSLSLAEHASAVAIAGFTIVVNFWWLRVALRFIHYIIDSAFYERGGLEFLAYDLLGILHETDTQGMIGPRTAVRLLAALATIFALRAWRRGGDRRRLAWLTLIVAMAALTFLGGYTFFAQIQPYRHNLPLGFALLIPAGWWLHEAARARPWRALAPTQRALGLTLALLAALHLARDVLYFFVGSMRERQVMSDDSVVLMNSLGHAYTMRYHYDQENDWERLLAWISERDDGQGRWLIEDQILGEYVTARTDAQVIGGFLVRNLEHSDANWFRRHGSPPYDPAAMQSFFATYGVRWVIVPKQELNPWWDAQRRMIIRAGVIGDMVIYQVLARHRLLDGPGRVDAALNRIEVSGTDPKRDVLLRYHWMGTLRCRPECTIERVPVEGDRVGFIAVPAPHPAAFVIENDYSVDSVP